MWTTPGEADVRVRQAVVDRRRDERRRPAARRGGPPRCGTRTSVSSGPCGPCCSVEPVGTMTVWWSREEGLDLGVGHLAQEHGRRLHRRSSSASRQAMVVVSSPMPSIQTVTMSPARSGGPGPSGAGEPGRRPVAMRSPGRSVDVAAEVRDDLGDREAHLRRPAVLDRRSPLMVQPSREVAGSSSSARHDPRADRAEAGHRLAQQPLVAVEPRVARRDVVDARVAEDVLHGASAGDAAAGAPMTTPSSHSASTLAVSVAVPGERRAVAGDRRAALP